MNPVAAITPYDELAAKLQRFTRFDLGSGPTPAVGYHGLDWNEMCPFEDSDTLTSLHLMSGLPWPIPNEHAEALHSSHFIEHIDACHLFITDYTKKNGKGYGNPPGYWQDALCWFMDEAWRITKNGGRFTLRWPAPIRFGDGKMSPAAFADPTHRRFIPIELLRYFERPHRENLGHLNQTRCNWKILHMEQCRRGAPIPDGMSIDEGADENYALLERHP